MLSGVPQVADQPSETRSTVVAGQSRQRYESHNPILSYFGFKLVKKSIGVVDLSDQNSLALVAHLEFGVSITLMCNAGNRANRLGFGSESVSDDGCYGIRPRTWSPVQRLGVAARDLQS